MPGLRSLVARRRSSLTSPPYTVQRNTPSPSISDTSDHAVTPHHSEGGESPMTERGSGVGEVQETQAQDVSEVQGADGSKAQNMQSINGEDTSKKDGCSSVNVGNSEQEKSLLDASEVEDPGGEPHTSATSEMYVREEKESSAACDVSDVCGGRSFTDVQSEVKYAENTLCGGSEQNRDQTTTSVKIIEKESYTDAEPNPPAGYTASHDAEPVVSKETSIYEDEDPLKTGGGETSEEKELVHIDGERFLPFKEEIKGSDGDVEKERETNVNDNVRQEMVCQAENWDAGGGLGGGGEDNAQTKDECKTGVERESEEIDESHLESSNICTRDVTTIPEEKEDSWLQKYRVVTEGPNEDAKPTETGVQSYHVVNESVCESNVYATENVELYLNVSEKRRESRTRETVAENIVEDTEKTEEFPNYGMKEDEMYISGDGKGANEKDAISCDNGGSAGEETDYGMGVGLGGDNGRQTLQNPSGSCPASMERSEQGEGDYGSEMLDTNMEDAEDEYYKNMKRLHTAHNLRSEGAEHYPENAIMDTIQEAQRSDENKGESDSNVENRQTEDKAEVTHKGESPPLNKKADGDSETNPGSSTNTNVSGKLGQKNTKGGKKCSDLSAMEIESTLASRGVTIVRRVLDNKESAGRGNELTSTVKKESVTSIMPVNKGVFGKAPQTPFRAPTASGSGISVSLQPTQPGQANSPTSKDLYKSINARGTHIQTNSKINPALLNRRGSFQLTRGVSIHYNPKSAATNMNARGNTVYPNPRGVPAVGSRGPRMYANPRVPGVQTPRGFQPNMRPRGASLPQPRQGTPQASVRGPVNPINTRGMPRPQRYTSPRGPAPRGAVPQPRMPSVNPSSVRGVAPQRFRGGMSQHHQPRFPGLPPQVRPTEGVLSPKAGEIMQSRSTTAPPQAKYLKTSPDSRPGDTILQSRGGGMSTQLRPQDALHSSRPGSAEVSPQSRTSQFSPQSLMGGIQPQSPYGAPSTQPKTLELSPQSVHAMSSASAATSQTGPVSFTSQPVSASHHTLPSSSHHHPQMNMMDNSQTNAMGLSPHSGSRRLPPHSSGGFMAPPTSLGSSSQVHPSHMAASERFSSSIGSGGFSTIPSSEYLGRPGTDMFPSYSNPGDYSPHSTTSGYPHMSSGDFGLQSTSGGFHTQTNLVGFSPQNDPCGYPQHASTSEFPPHNPAGVVRQTGSNAFASHPNHNAFPVPGNPGTYPPIPCSEPYSASTNPGTFRENPELFNYPGQREFMMHTGSRDFPHYSSSNQMTSQHQPLPAAGHRDIPISQSPRDLPLQNCNQGIPMPSTGGNSSLSNIIGDQYTSFGEPVGHSTYQEIPGNARTNSNTVPLAPNFRETNIRQNFRDSATPQYNSYQEPNPQEGIRTSQMHSGFRDMQMDPNVNLETQSPHSSFKDQQSARYQEDGIISRYLEQSVLNYPETDNLNTCREQPVSNFGSPASHASPNEQIMPTCRENIPQINFPDTMNETRSRQHLMPGLGGPMNYGSYRGPMEFNSGCEQPNPNLQESLNYVSGCPDSPNINPVAKSVADGMYKDHIPVSSYNVNSHHLSLGGVRSDMKFKEKDMKYSETALLPSFTESFDHSASEISAKKDRSANLPHFRGSSDVSYQRNLPEYTNPATPFENHGGDASTSATTDYSYCLSDSKNSGLKESPVYSSQRGYATPSYSPAQSDSPDLQYIGGSGNNFQAKSDFHIPGDSLVPPDKEILEFPISQGSSTITSTNSTQSDPSGRSIPDSSVTKPETDISSSKVSTSANHVLKNNARNIPKVELHKDAKESDTSNFLGSGKGRAPARTPGSDSPTKSPGSHSINSTEKFALRMSPNKSDSGSPSTQDRIVIKMKLLHSSSSAEEDIHSGESANTTELGLANKSSFKYNLAKYTCWTIDSIINGREDLGGEEILDKNNDCDIEEINGKEEKEAPVIAGPPKTRKRKKLEICEDLKDTNLDTNKNLMKKSLKITITNPMRNKMPPADDGNKERNMKEKHEDVIVDNMKDDDKVQLLGSVCEERGNPEQKPVNQLKCSSKKRKAGSGKSPKSPSVTRSAETCNSSDSGAQRESEGRCGKGTEASPGSGQSDKVNNHLVKSDVKKCSIVIKRIHKNDNYSCYSSSLCDKKTVLSIDNGTQRRSKRRAAVEASERFQKTLSSFDPGDAKSGKVSLTGVLSKNKKFLSVNLTTNKTVVNQIPKCSVLLYDVFMNHRINQMVCPGCSRHYDSSDSVQVNMAKATISLLCSSCHWLVVKDVHQQEVDSLVPS